MVTVIKKGADRSIIHKRLLKRKKSRKLFDADKHCGAISLKQNPLDIQKQLRDEWE